MPTELAAVQQAFATVLRDRSSLPGLAVHLRQEGERAAERMAIYRGNVIAGVTRALGQSYPVVEELVGAEFFGALARAYWSQVPSVSGDLSVYGASFAGFIDGFHACACLPYLGDVARLEWAVHEAESAASAARADPVTLSGLDEAATLSMHVTFLPGTVLVTSSHPAGRIWLMHQEGFDGSKPIDLDQSESALVWRDAWTPRVRVLAAAEAALYRTLLDDAALSVALDAAYEADSSADHGALLIDLLHNGPLAGFTLNESTKDTA